MSKVQMLYENLDWEDGRQGGFGPQARSRTWDLIILSDCTYNTDTLPALVETLSALHSSNQGVASTKVLLATKPRHSSERVSFDLMSEQKWRIIGRQVVPLPLLGSEEQSVEMYMFEKP